MTTSYTRPYAAAIWVATGGFAVLNVAGNSERTTPGIEAFADRYLTTMLTNLRGLVELPTKKTPRTETR